MITVEGLPSSNANETDGIHSTRKESVHLQTSYVNEKRSLALQLRFSFRYVHVRTRKKSCLIISVIAALLGISLVVIISKIVLTKLKTPIKTTEVSIAETTTTKPILVTETETTASASMAILQVNGNTTWSLSGVTVAGGNGPGVWFDQLAHPTGFDIDDDSSIYIADRYNDRVVRWKLNARLGEVLAGGRGSGNQTDQLWEPSDVVIDRKNPSLIICDRGNARLIRLLHNSPSKQATVLLKTDCNRLAMDNNGDLYLSRVRTHTVQRWKEGEAYATTVAGQNKNGNLLNQLHQPEHIFVDGEYSIYISDSSNDRVVKWLKGANEGVLVAGGQGAGNNLTQLHYPFGLTVDHFGNIYVVDKLNSRVMRFLNGSPKGTMILGGLEHFSHLLGFPDDISFDRLGNLYVVGGSSHRVQKFDVHH